jgi:glycosyltransferase involved in cell wall biosynthesis
MRHKEFDRKSIYRKYNLPMEVPVIIFAGRLDQVKGLAYFIQASKIVLDQIPNCQIIIAGSGDYHIFMKERGNKWMNIHFSGLLEKKELYELYSIADFGVMPSFHEQCSYVAIEMMMYGLPIIGSTSTGLSEMIDEGVTGLHVPVEEFEDKVEIDVILLAEKILYLLENESVRKQMSINARRRYETMYTSEIFSQNMLKFYQSLYTE